MISNLADIHPNAKIGENVEIEPFAYIEEDVVIGDGTKILSRASIMNGARIGKNCTIHGGAVVSGIPQDLKFNNEHSTAVIGDNTVIREYATVNRGTASKGTTIVGNNCLLKTSSHVGHDAKIGNNVVLDNKVSVAGEVVIDDWARLGGHSGIHQFCIIGSHTTIADGVIVTKDVPPYVTAANTPVSFQGIDTSKLRRRGFDNEVINIIEETYNILYSSNMNVSEACQYIENNIEQSEHTTNIIDFVKSSSRGIIP